MPISILDSLLIIFVVGLATFVTRAFPFILFPEGKEIPKVILYLGKYLAPAIIGLLVVYALKATEVMNYPYGIPELIASVTVVALHVWKRNTLLSIGTGTVLYMVLIQTIF